MVTMVINTCISDILMDVWDWHWGFAALFAAPGLAFLIPGVILSIIEGVKK
jgi:hypothetical protein